METGEGGAEEGGRGGSGTSLVQQTRASEAQSDPSRLSDSSTELQGQDPWENRSPLNEVIRPLSAVTNATVCIQCGDFLMKTSPAHGQENRSLQSLVRLWR